MFCISLLVEIHPLISIFLRHLVNPALRRWVPFQQLRWIFGAGLVWIFAQVWYGYYCAGFGMDICGGLVWKGMPGKGGWRYLQLLNIFLVIPKNKRSSFYFSNLIISLTTSERKCKQVCLRQTYCLSKPHSTLNSKQVYWQQICFLFEETLANFIA